MQANSTWAVDPGHSTVQFKIKHLAVSNVNGRFKAFQGQVASPSEDFNGAEANVTINADSIDTNNPQRDGHLMSPDFFNVATYPAITYNGMLQKSGETYILEGELTIREATHPVNLDVELTGIGKGRFGDTRAGFEAKGKLNRKHFGLAWNILAEGGGFVLGDEVALLFDIQLIKQ